MPVFSEAVIISGSLAPIALHLFWALSQLSVADRRTAQLQLPFAFL